MEVNRDRVRGWFARLGVYGWLENPDWDAAVDRLVEAGVERIFACVRVDDDRRAAVVAEMRAAGVDAVFPVLAEMLASDDPNEPLGTVEAALLTDRVRGLGFVLPLLRSPDSTMRLTVCYQLREHLEGGDGRAVPALLDVLRGEPEPGVRVAAVGALGRFGGPAVIPDLLAAFDHDHEVDELGHTPSHTAAMALDDIVGASETHIRVGNCCRLPDGPPDLARLRRMAEECYRDWSADRGQDETPPRAVTAEES